MRTYLACLILFGTAMVLSGCVERHYRPYYDGRGGYYGGYYGGYSHRDRHHRRHYDDRYRFRDHRDDWH